MIMQSVLFWNWEIHTNGKKTMDADLSAIIEGLLEADVKFIGLVLKPPAVQGDKQTLYNGTSYLFILGLCP